MFGLEDIQELPMLLLDRRNVKYQIGNSLVNTGIDHFGAVLGNNCAIGASVIILPGRQIQPNRTDSDLEP